MKTIKSAIYGVIALCECNFLFASVFLTAVNEIMTESSAVHECFLFVFSLTVSHDQLLIYNLGVVFPFEHG